MQANHTRMALCWLGSLLIGACADVDPPSRADEALLRAEPDLPAELEAALLGGHASDALYSVDHNVPVGRDRWIHLRETASAAAWRGPRRAVLMLPGPLVHGDFYQIDVEGYRGRDIIAREGAFAFTADFEGTGESSYPADGRTATHDRQLEAMQVVLRYIRLVRRVARIDVLGESWGGGVAAELCADTRRVRSCVLASMLYRTPSDFANMTFRSPGFRALLDSLPAGYLPTAPELYYGLAMAMPPEVAGWTFENIPGVYTIVPLLDVYDLPFFDATIGRAPGLLIQGENDPNQSLDDARDLAAQYGGSMRLAVIAGGGHIPRTEAPPSNEQYWAEVLGFLELDQPGR